jgi:predicted  nucleic acid-binding Zn-ribbon protein
LIQPNGFFQDEVEKMMKMIEEKRKQISELQVIIDSMKKNMGKHVSEFTTELAEVSESKEEIECASKSPFHVRVFIFSHIRLISV